MDFPFYSFALLILCVTATTVSGKKDCLLKDDCPAYAECKNRNCTCLYGGDVTIDGVVNFCENECNLYDDCPKNAHCNVLYKCECGPGYKRKDWTIGRESLTCVECNDLHDCPIDATCSNNNCECTFGGAFPSTGKPTYCRTECIMDGDCPTHAECKGNNCECKYGGSYWSNGKLISCSDNILGIVLGTIGAVVFMILIITAIIISRRQRQRRTAQSTASVHSPAIATNVPVADRPYQAVYPVQQYLIHPPNQAHVNYGCLQNQPPPYIGNK